jgi:hypothetical protein
LKLGGGWEALLDEVEPNFGVCLGKEKITVCRLTIAPSPTNFLVILLDGFRDKIMDYDSNIRNVDRRRFA